MDEQRSIERLGLEWLVRLRWIACAGIVIVSALAAWRHDLLLPWWILGGTVAYTAAGNLVALWLEQRGERELPMVVAMVLGDIVMLTVMLYFTGGAHNPFTVLYLLHITLAVMLLGRALAWGAVVLCGVSFAYLFTSTHMLTTRVGLHLCTDLDFHLQGMLVATVIAGAGVVYFVTQLNSALAMQREALVSAKAAVEREKRFAGLATLAAGLAHELATPLSTIAVVSTELESEARDLCRNAACFDDVRLIRSEVERCRAILEKIGSEAVGHGGDEYASLDPGCLEKHLPDYLPPPIINRVRWKIDPSVPPLRTLGDHVTRSLAVLVKNAVEASAPGIAVDVEVRPGVDGKVDIVVCDSGTGMSSEIAERLGEPFFTTKQAGVGMGLGFFLVRTLVARLGGEVAVQSCPGAGTEVTMSLPAHRSVQP